VPELIRIDRLAQLGPEEMIAAIRPLFEESPWLAGRIAGRSFSGWDNLIDVSEALLREANDAEKAEVLRSHPRLGARQEELRRRSEASWREQGAGRDPGVNVLGELSAANDRYEARFGFPFVDWVAGRTLEEMIPVIESRLTSNPSSELSRGCQALINIARDRLGKIAGSGGSKENSDAPHVP
jgi:2-oxo-4-hydroxy-4-carboxy--5-ureidoimidazoline (OHCU) decarboxylase